MSDAMLDLSRIERTMDGVVGQQPRRHCISRRQDLSAKCPWCRTPCVTIPPESRKTCAARTLSENRRALIMSIQPPISEDHVPTVCTSTKSVSVEA